MSSGHWSIGSEPFSQLWNCHNCGVLLSSSSSAWPGVLLRLQPLGPWAGHGKLPLNAFHHNHCAETPTLSVSRRTRIESCMSGRAHKHYHKYESFIVE